MSTIIEQIPKATDDEPNIIPLNIEVLSFFIIKEKTNDINDTPPTNIAKSIIEPVIKNIYKPP
jgi:hypothetical protein